ncbi:MAG: iron-sulfur cluster assembly accessory protein [Deltaproteobacteria bacterium]|nr:MAG: iron-sulfur cluster assembly accessory protein [Deltaproteobacteria bacterium]
MSNPIHVTEDAAQRMKALQAAQNWSDWGLRFGLKESGCSGYAYQLDFEAQPEDDDLVFEEHGVKVFVHPLHLPFLAGATIQYKDELLESGFVVDNPNVRQECGCGSSFSVE